MNGAGADVKAVKQYVHSNHYGNDHEPKGRHDYRTSTGVNRPDTGTCGTGSGPCSISRPTRKRKSIPRMVYIPAKPRKVNQPFSADTNLEKPSSVRSRP